MRDEETGSFWQQIGGKAISGPLTGRELPLIHSDELSFATWKAEESQGKVLAPVGKFASEYENKDWEKHIAKAQTVVDTKGTGHPPREIILGVEANGASRAFPLQRVLSERLVQDRVGGEPVLLVVGSDGQSVRAFRARMSQDAPAPDYYRNIAAASAHKFDPKQPLFIDSATGSDWNFRGCAVNGKLQGLCLQPLDVLKDYWFDWHLYHPRTTVYAR